MSNAAHTPGPWSLDASNEGELWVKSENPRLHPVCMVTAAGHVTERDRADARLIAAAPELLEALKALDAAMCGGFEKQSERTAARKAIINARAAIAKATTGDTP